RPVRLAQWSGRPRRWLSGGALQPAPGHQPGEQRRAVGPGASDRAGRGQLPARGGPRGLTELASPGRLRELFSPASIALVGASDTSGWALNVYNSLRTGGFVGRFTPVHPRHPTAFGLDTRRSLRALEEPADLAFVLAPTHAVEEVINDAAAAGTRNL